MSDEVLNDLLKDFDYMRDNQRKCRKIQRLLQDNQIKEFINLTCLDYKVLKSGYKVYTYDELIKMIIKKYIGRINYDDTNKIYVFINTFKVINGRPYYFVDEFNYYDYKTYHNIESENEEVVPQSFVNNFEKDNTILYAPSNIDNELFYEKVQLDFFKELVKNNQESAKELILKKY